MPTKIKTPAKPARKKIPAPGRKMTKVEACDYVFKQHGGAVALLAKK